MTVSIFRVNTSLLIQRTIENVPTSMLSMQVKMPADDTLKFFLYFFNEIGFDISCKLSSNLLNPCPAELINMPRPFQIFSQSDYLIWVSDRNSHI